MAASLSRGQVLAWRATQQALAGTGERDVESAVHRVVTLRSWPADQAELAIAVRLAKPALGGLEAALASGALIRSYALRGGSYVFTHDIAALFLAVRTTTRIWETRRWQQQGSFAIDDWQPVRHAIREALASGPKTREELQAHIQRIPALKHLAKGATGAGGDSFYKPMHWWGDICFGPYRDGQPTFRLLAGDPRWPGLPEVDEAGPRAIALYLGAYGPATIENLTYWFVEGLGVPRQRLLAWLADLGSEIEEVTLDTKPAYVLAASLKGLRAAKANDAIGLLPGYDPWIMGPGTADAWMIAPARRALATRGGNLVTQGGVVAGTWRIRKADLTVTWFKEGGAPPAATLQAQAERIGHIVGRELNLVTELG